MSYELREVREWALGTIVHPKYEIFDRLGVDAFTITLTTFELFDTAGDVVTSGNCTVNNTDADTVGNVIKTVEADVNLTETWAVAGHYVLVFFLTIGSGETEKLSVPIKIKAVP